MSFSICFLGCSGSIQDESASNTSILLKSDSGSILIDTSGNLNIALIDNALKAVFYSHEHIDHVYALPSLLHQLWLKGRKEVLLIYAPNETISIIDSLIDIFHIREKRNMFDIKIVSIDKLARVGDISIAPFKTDHTNDSYGFAIKCGNRTLIYTSDTRPIKDFSCFTHSPDILIAEASGLSENEEILIKKGHQSAIDAANLALSIDAKKLFLVHLPATDKAKEEILLEAKSSFPLAEIPKVGQEYRLW